MRLSAKTAPFSTRERGTGASHPGVPGPPHGCRGSCDEGHTAPQPGVVSRNFLSFLLVDPAFSMCFEVRSAGARGSLRSSAVPDHRGAVTG